MPNTSRQRGSVMSIDYAGLVSHGGQPAKLQRFKIIRAQKRSRVAKFIRCKIGWHNPPADCYFEEMGSVVVGGPCTRCDDEMFREVTWIGDVWDFKDAIKVTKTGGGSGTTIYTNLLEDAVRRHIDALLA